MSENDEKIKIIFLINDVILGGAQNVVLNLASLLDRKKFNVKVCYLKDTANIKPGDSDYRKEFGEANIEMIGLGGSGKSKINDFLRLFKFLKKKKPDILHCHLFYSSILGLIVGKIVGVKKIIAHEHNTHKFFPKKITLLLKFIRPLFDLTICFSDFVEMELFGNSKILNKPIDKITRRSYTIFNGINLDLVDSVKENINFEKKRKELGVDSKDMLVVSVGRLIPWKGHENLIKSFSYIIKKYNSIKLIVVGWGSGEEYLKKLIIKLGLEKNVKILGTREDVYEILSVSNIFSLVLSYGKEINAESIGIAGFEAMAFGLPPIVGDYPAVHKFIKNGVNGIIAEPNNPKALADSITLLVEEKDKRLFIGENARKYIESDLSWRKLVKIYESLYCSILKT